MPMKPSARKSYGEYKPVIIHYDADRPWCERSEIVGTKSKWVQIQAQTKFYSGPSEKVIHKRGKTFPTREAAIEYAQKVIDLRVTATEKYMAEYAERQAKYEQQRQARNA